MDNLNHNETLEKFCRNNDISVRTVVKNKDKIPGLLLTDDECRISEGTRYPYNVGRNSLKTIDDKRYVLLKATYNCKYIDHSMLKTDINEFNNIIEELVSAGLLERNGLANRYGANAYRCTLRCKEFLGFRKRKAIKFIINTMAEAIGTAAGACFNQINNN